MALRRLIGAGLTMPGARVLISKSERLPHIFEGVHKLVNIWNIEGWDDIEWTERRVSAEGAVDCRYGPWHFFSKASTAESHELEPNSLG
ncbi:hypothetical protein BC831DRAFT_480302 [Entophlyctis helioformis]|nr:hypothetical protein BC831DRAFT_480302 [Entophlyctis helioformis]